jgi:hypothetical protein
MVEFTTLTRRGRERVREVFTGRKAASLADAEVAAAWAAGYEPDDDGSLVGRDPRTMSSDELRAMGCEPMSALSALRAKCLDCCAGSPHEVRKCVVMTCPSWPFRMGSSPWRAKPTEEQLAVMRERGRRLAASDKSLPSSAEDASDVSEAGTAVPAVA